MKTKSQKEHHSKAWIVQAIVCGLSWGVGNTIFSMNVTQYNYWGASFTSPASLLTLTLIRFVQACKSWAAGEAWFDKAKSKYWRLHLRLDAAAQGEEAEAPSYSFDWGLLAMIVLALAVFPYAGLVLVSLTFRLALLA